MTSSRARVFDGLLNERQRYLPILAVNQTVTAEVMKGVGAGWPEGHMDSDKMASLAIAGHLVLGFDNVRIPFDQTVEAEALGGRVAYGGELDFPEVHVPIEGSPADLKVAEDVLSKGRIPVVLDAIAKARNGLPCNAPIVGGIVGPFSVGAQAFGLETYLKLTIRNPEGVSHSMEVITPFLVSYAKEMVKRGADIIAIEDMASSPDMLNPKFFRQRVAPHLKKLISSIEAPVILHVCGNATAIVADLVDLGAAAISLDAKTDLRKASKAARGKVKLAGNLSPVDTLLRGTPEDIKLAVNAAVEAGIDIVSPGCSLSPLTSTENVKALVQATREIEGKRASTPAYAHLENVYVNYAVREMPKSGESPVTAAEDPLAEVAAAVVRGDVAATSQLTKEALSKYDPSRIIKEALTAGIDTVGILWDRGEFFLPEVILASDAMQAGVKICEDAMGRPMERKGRILTFVAEGDIHDIGKNIVVSFLKAGGYEVVDLGKDVPSQKVVDEIVEKKPILVCGTALMTTTMSAFPRIARALQEKGIEVPLAIGGGAVTKEFAESFPMGVYGERADEATKIADLARQGKKWGEIRAALTE
jgi:MtaA/CmuA family methyltransferase